MVITKLMSMIERKVNKLDFYCLKCRKGVIDNEVIINIIQQGRAMHVRCSGKAILV